MAPEGSYSLNPLKDKHRSGAWLQKAVIRLHTLKEKHTSGTWFQKASFPSFPWRDAEIWGIAPDSYFSLHSLKENNRSGVWLQKASILLVPLRKRRDLGHGSRRGFFVHIPRRKSTGSRSPVFLAFP